MKKQSNLKKLALLGITGGLVLSAQGVQAQETTNPLENGTHLAAGCKTHGCSVATGCGGSGGSCGAHHNPSNDQGYRDTHSCNGNNGNNSNNGYNYNGQAANEYYNPDSSSTNMPSTGNPKNDNSGKQSANNNRRNSGSQIADSDESVKTVQKQLTERELQDQLNPESKALFQDLTPEGKKLALKLANQSCKGNNDCKGLNSCKTEANSCAGQGGCKGKSPGPFLDKNKAVKVASQKMNEKRKNLNK